MVVLWLTTTATGHVWQVNVGQHLSRVRDRTSRTLVGDSKIALANVVHVAHTVCQKRTPDGIQTIHADVMPWPVILASLHETPRLNNN